MLSKRKSVQGTSIVQTFLLSSNACEHWNVLQGELTPILVQMVKSANTNGLLDNDCDSSKYQTLTR